MAGLEDEALDILWGMMMEEGYEHAFINLDIERMQLMIKSHAAFSSVLEFDEIPIANNSSVIDVSMPINRLEEQNAIIEKQKSEIASCVKNGLKAKFNWEHVHVDVTSLCPPDSERGDQDSKKFIVLINVK